MSIMNLLSYMKIIRRTRETAKYFSRLKILVLSNNNVFSNNNISINIYR